jgi:hypothetical protein
MFKRFKNLYVRFFQRINKQTNSKLANKKTRSYKINHQSYNTQPGLLNWLLRKCKFVICSKQINKSKNIGS